MTTNSSYRLFLPVALAMLAACTVTAPDTPSPSIEVNAGVSDVSLTKAPLGSADLATGSAIKLYDVIGTSFTRHIDGKTTTFNGTKWNIADAGENGYQWKSSGVPALDMDHNFFGWLTTDKDGLTAAGLFGSAPAITPNSPDDGIYTVTLSKEMLLTSTQFDFSWSDMVQRPATGHNYSIVPLQLHHLFTCFGIKAINYSSSEIVIKSIKLQGLVNNKTATLTYNVNTGDADCSYDDEHGTKTWSGDASALELVGSNITIASAATSAGTVVNNVMTNGTGKSTSATDAFFLMWPQTATEMTDHVQKVSDVWSYTQGDPVLVVTYSANSGADVVVPVGLRPLTSSNGWDAGTRHQLELAFSDKFITLSAEVLPWDYSEPAVDYTASVQVAETGTLAFSGCVFGTGDNADCIFFKNGNPITGYFCLNNPTDATWLISKDGDFDAFEIDNTAFGTYGDGVDYNYGTIDGNTAYFTIYPKIADPQRDYVITLTFAVRTATGSVLNADVVQGETKRKIVLLAS